MANFDLYKGDTKVQDNVTSPITITGLTPETDYSDYAVSYAGETKKTPVPTFTTKAASNVAVTGVTMSQKTAAMKVGATKQVTGTVAPENATDKAVTYASDNEAIATVAADGTITANAEGTANITTTTHDGSFTDKCVVTVSAAE